MTVTIPTSQSASSADNTISRGLPISNEEDDEIIEDTSCSDHRPRFRPEHDEYDRSGQRHEDEGNIEDTEQISVWVDGSRIRVAPVTKRVCGSEYVQLPRAQFQLQRRPVGGPAATSTAVPMSDLSATSPALQVR